MVELLENYPINSCGIQDLTHAHTGKNLCVFQGPVYKFPDGFPMGGLLSVLMADVSIDSLETELLRSSPHSISVRFWRRYVDDIICIWTGGDLEAQSLLEDLSRYDLATGITFELGGNLDLHIPLVERDNVLCVTFGIFRKSSHVGVFPSTAFLHPPHPIRDRGQSNK